tara:strand:+ start:1075 stop:2106 length:1032 start_codon:yes stop_codon:yes gene_type:complete
VHAVTKKSKKLKNSKKKFLVIGSNSFSGSHFVNFCLKKNDKVIGISRSKEPSNVFLPYKSSLKIKNFKFIRIDLNKDVEKIISIIKKFKITYVVNFASQSMVGESWENPLDWYNTNVVGSINFLNKLAKIKSIKKYVHISTPEVYGSTKINLRENKNYNPTTPYAISRAACDMHLYSLYSNYKFPVIFTRAANVYGPGQQLYRIVPKCILTPKIKSKLTLDGGGASKRSFIYITDVVEATYKLCFKSINGEIYHISGEKLISIKNLVSDIFKLQKIPMKNFVKISKERKGKDKIYSLNSNKIINLLNWKPKVNLREGLEKTISWVNKNLIELKKQPNKYIHKK